MKTTTKTASKKSAAKTSTKSAPKRESMNARLARVSAEFAKKADKKPAKEKPTYACMCQCGAMVVGFVKQGHDMRVKAQLRAKLGESFEKALAKAGSLAALARENGFKGGRPLDDEPKAPVAEKKGAKKAAPKKRAAKKAA